MKFTEAMGGAMEADRKYEDLGSGLRLDHHARVKEPPNDFCPPQTPMNKQRKVICWEKKSPTVGG